MLSDSEKLLLYWRYHPVMAARDMFNVELAWFQRRTLRDMFEKKHNMLLFGRGIGKTWLCALYTMQKALLYPNTKIGILAPSFKQTEFFFDKIDEIAANTPYFKSCMKSSQRATFRAIQKFNNGSFIEGLPLGTGQKIRGRRYNVVIIDEYASLNEEIIQTVIRPMLNVKLKGQENQIIISGTAFWSWNHYYRQFLLYSYQSQVRPELWGLHEYDKDDVSIDLSAPFELDEQMYEMMKMDTTNELYMMETHNKFPIEGQTFFTSRLIESCTPKQGEFESPLELELIGAKNAVYAMGVDVARSVGGDNFVIAILKINGAVKELAHVFMLNGEPYQKMVFHIRRLFRDFPIAKICMDLGGGGSTLQDLLAVNYTMPGGLVQPAILDVEVEDPQIEGLRILHMIHFSQQEVNDLYVRLKAEMEHKTVLFPLDIRRHGDKDIEKVAKEILDTKRELLVIQAEPNGNFYKFDVPHGFKKDRATALALANRAANLAIGNVKVKRALPVGMGFHRD